MPTLRSHLMTILLAVMTATAGVTVGCGGDDECTSDHDCEVDDGQREEVCEPDGCTPVCDDDTDCPATDTCSQRRVEEGKVCVTEESVFE